MVMMAAAVAVSGPLSAEEPSAGAADTVPPVPPIAAGAGRESAATATAVPAAAIDTITPAQAPSAAGPIVPADTPVWLETVQPLSSAALKRGDAFALRVAEPVVVDGVVVVPAGAACHGEVIHADRSRGGGKPGELLLAARYIEHGGRRIPLRGFRLSGAGREKTGAALGAALVVGPFAMFVRGGQIEIPVGARAQARFTEALDLLSAPAVASAAPAPASVSNPAATPSAAATPSISAKHPTTGEAVQ